MENYGNIMQLLADKGIAVPPKIRLTVTYGSAVAQFTPEDPETVTFSPIPFWLDRMGVAPDTKVDHLRLRWAREHRGDLHRHWLSVNALLSAGALQRALVNVVPLIGVDMERLRLYLIDMYRINVARDAFPRDLLAKGPDGRYFAYEPKPFG